MLKHTTLYVALLALTLLTRAVAAQTPAAAPASEPASERWTTRATTEVRCLEPTDTTVHARLQAELRHVQFPDSTAAVELALRALGGRAKNPMARVTAYKRAPNGIMVAVDLYGGLPPEKRASIRDGSATVYVYNSGCVTLLGW